MCVAHTTPGSDSTEKVERLKELLVRVEAELPAKLPDTSAHMLEIQQELKTSVSKAAAARETLTSALAKVQRAEGTLQEAQEAESSAVAEAEVALKSHFPCPVCRSVVTFDAIPGLEEALEKGLKNQQRLQGYRTSQACDQGTQTNEAAVAAASS